MHTSKTSILLSTLLIFIATFATTAVGQNQQPVADDFVTTSGFKNRVFDVRNRLPEDLVPVIRELTSGIKGARLSASNEFHAITVRDYPANIDAIEAALKRFDIPETARPDIELRMQVLLASTKEALTE